MKSSLILMAALLVPAAGAQAQKKSAPAVPADSVFSSDSRLVVIDAIVTDRKGAYVEGLTQKDFKVREDGREQTLTSFFGLKDESSSGDKPCVVLLFDNLSVPQVLLHLAQDAALKLIAGGAGPGRLMAVAEFDTALRVRQNLTSDAESLKLAVNQVQTSNLLGPPVLRSGGDTNALAVVLRNLAKGLAKAPGRKEIILFSEGANVNPDVLKAAVEECNRYNAAVYPVDIGALGARGDGVVSTGDASLSRVMTPPATGGQVILRPGSMADLSASRPASEALYTLARGTGGFVVSSLATLEEQIKRIGSEQREYYALGYLPSKDSAPGGCHSIKVDVDRGGLTVRARSSYCDEQTPELLTGTPSERDLEARLDANAPSTIPATMQAPFFYVAPNTARVDLAVDIPGTGVKFVKDKGKFTAAVNVIGIAYLPDNGVAARFSDTRKVTLEDQKQVNEFAAQTYHYEKQFEMPAGAFDMKVAFSSGASAFGALELPLAIEAWDPSKFSMSALALSQSVRQAAGAGQMGDVDLFGDNVALVANGIQFTPAGTNRFRKTEKAFVYGEIYAPATPDVNAQMTVADTATGGTAKQGGIPGLRPESVSGISRAVFGVPLPVADLAPGAWTAQVIAQDASGHRALRRIDFVLAP